MRKTIWKKRFSILNFKFWNFKNRLCFKFKHVKNLIKCFTKLKQHWKKILIFNFKFLTKLKLGQNKFNNKKNKIFLKIWTVDKLTNIV